MKTMYKYIGKSMYNSKIVFRYKYFYKYNSEKWFDFGPKKVIFVH